MIRKIVNIDAEKCNGCGACASACHEAAIVMIDGKARLIKDDYCDGLGDCLPACPMDAITIVEREAAAYDHEAVMARLESMKETDACETAEPAVPVHSRLKQWPVQIKLAPIRAPFFNGCKLLIAADCTAYAYGNFHNDFIADHVTLIGCPKLDAVNYAEKLAEIFRQNDIREITVTRMTVPCCGGMGMAVQQAVAACGKDIPVKIVTIDTDGTIVS
ncbi:MAG: 4Fe-4S binding protein [Lachnospiraceae bacterium]|nr:4Fe-4S binding protein [Lachnospiraceae bacterium]